MKDYEREIARKYLLPERPFLHGMASAFDLFGVLSVDSLEQLGRRRKAKRLMAGNEALRHVWQDVGDTLLEAIDQFEKESGESGST